MLHDRGICDDCMENVKGPLVMRHSLPRNSHLDEVHHFWWYEGVVERVIKLYKYGDRVKFRRVLAVWILKTLAYFNALDIPITWVPSSYSALKSRGFETMKCVARELERMGLKICELLDCVGDVPPQVGSSFRERLERVRGKYRILYAPPPQVVIIDDVYTTGATLNECARVLKDGGARYVMGVTVARVKLQRGG